MDRKKGYTLIELIIVIALISILLSIAIPSLGIIEKFKEQQQIKQLKRDILYAKTQAILEGERYNIICGTVTNVYWVRKGEIVVEKVYLENDLKFVDTTNNVKIEFSPSGVPINTGTIKLENSDKERYTITITPVVGKVNITKQ